MPVLILFFVSGFASLVLETVFRRQLTLFLGSAVAATSWTLAIFLGGLALGAAVIGKAADRTSRPLRLYGVLEIGAAATGISTVVLLAVARDTLLAPARWAGSAAPAIEGAISVLLLLPSAALMGGTLPVLTRYLSRERGSVLTAVALLYGVNTLGAALGCAAAGFLLFETVGITGTGTVGAVLAALAGSAALTIDAVRGKRAPADRRERPHSNPAGEPRSSRPERRAAIILATVGGTVALGYEVVWTRLLVLPLRSYAYSFSVMLSLFLFGIVLGTLVVERLASRIERPLRVMAWLHLAASAYVASSAFWMPSLLNPPDQGGGFGGLIRRAWLHAAPIVLPPTIASGMALPLAIRAYACDAEGAGGDVGAAYAANTVGSILGALAAGLFLLPVAGVTRAVAILATIGAASGVYALFASAATRVGRWCGIAVAAVSGLAILVSGRSVVASFARGERLLYFREGATDTVAVVARDYGFRDPDAKSVLVNGISMTATVKPVWRYMAAEGHIPALLAPDPSSALVICVGTGITLGALASHAAVASVDAVDLSESVLAALPVFDRENRGVRRDPKVHVIHADGRHLLELTSARYGLITLEPPPPIVAGSVHLYTLDFYALCRKHLIPGGVLAQWLPLHAQSLASAKATAQTFLRSFPHVQLWLPSVRDAILIGSDRPLRLDRARLQTAYDAPATRESLAEAYLETPEALLATFVLDRAGVARWANGADVVTDDRPLIEFFRRYGGVMADREIEGLLDAGPASFDDLLPSDGDPGWRAAIEAERAAHLEYVRADIDRDQPRSREAALAARGTRFGLYRLGCDDPQIAALRAGPRGETASRRQADLCRAMLGSR